MENYKRREGKDKLQPGQHNPTAGQQKNHNPLEITNILNDFFINPIGELNQNKIKIT